MALEPKELAFEPGSILHCFASIHVYLHEYLSVLGRAYLQ
jgi:hypothetical protein